MPFDLSTAEQIIGKGFGLLGRAGMAMGGRRILGGAAIGAAVGGGGRLAYNATTGRGLTEALGASAAAGAGVGAGLGLGLYPAMKFGAAMGAGAIGAAGKVGRAGLATGIGLTRGATWAGRKMGLGFKMHEMKVWGKTLRIPEQLNRRTQNALVFGTLGAAGLAGAASAAMGPRWNVNQAIGTGAVEVERPDFLGATGSLALSMSLRNKRTMPGHLVNYDVGTPGGNARVLGLEPNTSAINSRMVVSMADDVALMMAHRLIR